MWAGMVVNTAEYRWSRYREAVDGGNKGNGKKVREGLVRVFVNPDTRIQPELGRGALGDTAS
ncbi:MAG: hypothetical protein IZT59_08530 [Verrucomicrobia bacterium]|nr:hypothetical protein [Verrucomicrobiota bacterium]